MAKITLSNVASGYNRQNINTNFEDIETDLQEKVLYRDNPDGEANQMENELDMNSNDIANAKDIYTSKLYLNGERVIALSAVPLDTDTSWFYEDDDGNLSLGSTALDSNTEGSQNTANGYLALGSNTTGSSNTAYGSYALLYNTTGNYNTATGYRALFNNTTGIFNVATGQSALYSNTEGSYNTANGNNALLSNTTGDYNTAYGSIALYFNTTGYNNTATGYQALLYNTTGSNNVATGHQALNSNTTGGSNTATGFQALLSNTTAYYNTANGYRALYSNTTGSYNVANGFQALRDNTTGIRNVANGQEALYSNTTGIHNTACGHQALYSNTSYDNVSGFGFNAQVTGSDQIQLGDSDTTTYVYGTVQNRSDLRDKADVRGTVLGLGFITSLRPVDYRWDMREDYETATPDGTHKRGRYHHGFIAQEIAEVIEESGVDFGGYQDHKVAGGEDVLSLGYDELIGPLVKALQELNQKFDDYVKTHP